MKCPYCGCEESKVVDTRPFDESIRRRRECERCGRRFTTFEAVECTPLVVIKKDMSRQAFDISKLLAGMLRACEKRRVTLPTLERAAAEIETYLQTQNEREVPSTLIGELAMKKLQLIDEVAYIRFASVYREFKDVESFMCELKGLLEKRRG